MSHRAALWTLVAVAIVWGVTFVAIKEALAWMSPAVFLALRFGLASLLLLPLWRGLGREALRAGLVLGLLFFAGFVFQTAGLARTSPSRSAFITSLATAVVPLLAAALHRERPRGAVLAAVALGLAGTWLFTDPAGGGLNAGDLLTFGCAVMFAAQIVAAGRYARRFPTAQLLAVQLAVTAVLAPPVAPLLETPRLDPSPLAIALIVGTAMTGLGTFWGQLQAQAVVTPAEAALIFLLEPIAAAAASRAVYGERLAGIQWVGAGMILGAIVLPELKLDRTPRPPADGAMT
ncbi:MAG: DMT family transporter [Gemmatimonadales bacterium]|nr:DMT family transporter [Gemmatimonadales bacterium]